MYHDLMNDAAKVEQALLARNAARAWRKSQFKGWERQMLDKALDSVRGAVEAVFKAAQSAPTAPSAAERHAEA